MSRKEIHPVGKQRKLKLPQMLWGGMEAEGARFYKAQSRLGSPTGTVNSGNTVLEDHGRDLLFCFL
jgi:hypothetical protein